MPNARQTWPFQGSAASPAALTLTPDGILNSERPCVGPLRRGTYGDVGPKPLGGAGRGASDFGMDRISPRARDSIGQKYPETDTGNSRRVRR